MKSYNLVITDLDKPKKFPKILFLSDWVNCKYNETQVLKKPLKNFQIKLKKYNYINKLRKKIGNSFVNFLYNYHKKKYSKILLKNMTELWVGQYLQFIYLRWLMIDESIKKKKIFKINNIKIDNRVNDYLDTLDFMDLAFENDSFNYFHVKKILNYRKKEIKKKILFKEKKIQNYEKFKSRKSKKGIFFKLLSIIDIIVLPIIKKNRVFLKEGFSYKNLFFLNLKLNQIPFFGQQIFNWSEIKKNFNVKNEIKKYDLILKTSINFENYLIKNIIYDAPLIFFKNFDG